MPERLKVPAIVTFLDVAVLVLLVSLLVVEVAVSLFFAEPQPDDKAVSAATVSMVPFKPNLNTMEIPP